MGWPTTVFMQRLIPAIFAALSTLPSRSRNKVVRPSLAFQPSLRRESETQTREMTDGQAIDSAACRAGKQAETAGTAGRFLGSSCSSCPAAGWVIRVRTVSAYPPEWPPLDSAAGSPILSKSMSSGITMPRTPGVPMLKLLKMALVAGSFLLPASDVFSLGAG